MASKPVNINKANLTQLKAIKHIGDTRALAIIKKRDEKEGILTYEDLKEITEVPQSTWTTLFQEGHVCLEDPHELEEVVSLQKTIEMLRFKISSEEKLRTDMAESFQSNMDKMREQFKAQIEDMRVQHETQKEQYANNIAEELKQLKSAIKERDEAIMTAAEQNKKLQTQLSQKESIAKWQQVITEKEKEGPLSEKGKGFNFTSPDSFGPAPPKMSTYDGKNDWRPYHLQFSTIADRYKWNTEQRLFKLIECLRDKALKFYSSRPKFVQTNYEALCKKMDERFGRKEMPHIVRRLLQDLKQELDESLEEYAERAQELAIDGYPDTPDKFVQTLATDAFLKGCQDKRAALTAIDKNPENLDQAVQYVKGAMANQKVIMGTKRTEVKRVTFMESDEHNDDGDDDTQTQYEPSVRTVSKFEKNKGGAAGNDFESRLSKTEDDLQETKMLLRKL